MSIEKEMIVQSTMKKIERLMIDLNLLGVRKADKLVAGFLNELTGEEIMVLTDRARRVSIVETIRERMGWSKRENIPPFAELLAACNQDGGVSKFFTEENFPLEECEKNEEYETEVRVFRSFKPLSDLGSFNLLQMAGFRACGPRRAMEYIAEHQDIQLSAPIIVTTSWMDPESGKTQVPVFCAESEKRCLQVVNFELAHREYRHWLVLFRKTSYDPPYAEYRMKFGQLLPRK